MKHKICFLFVVALVGLAFSLNPGGSSFVVGVAYAKEESKSDKENSGHESENSEQNDSDKNKSEEDSKSNGKEKVEICHVPSGDVSQAHTISVSESAVDAHMKHGDMLGACPGCTCPPGFTSCVCPDGNPGWPGHSTPVSPGSQRELQGH